MKGFAYVIPRDFGFAPNPFGMSCTLATCKQDIRARAEVGDWVVGCGSAQFQLQNKIVYAMNVCEKLSFSQYWNDERFQYKKPIMTGSLKQMYGDNIYHRSGGRWKQEDSHHSNADGSINYLNLNRDTSSDNVLISSEFYYFGGNAIEIDENLARATTKTGRGYRNINEEPLQELISFLRDRYDVGMVDTPILFDRFERYSGK
ncbi:MAG: hypothetical protein OCC46_02855 [Pseudodesulfovibrio sp.]